METKVTVNVRKKTGGYAAIESDRSKGTNLISEFSLAFSYMQMKLSLVEISLYLDKNFSFPETCYSVSYPLGIRCIVTL